MLLGNKSNGFMSPPQVIVKAAAGQADAPNGRASIGLGPVGVKPLKSVTERQGVV